MKRTRLRNRLIIVAIVLVVAAVVLWQRSRPKAVVDVIVPQVRTLRAYVDEQAVTELQHDYLISMPISGWLQPIDLREGDAVSDGQVVARLDTADLEDRVSAITQQISALEAQIDKSRDNRLESSMLTEAEAAVAAMDATVQAAGKQVEASAAVAEFAKIRLERIGKSLEGGAATELELEEAEMDYRRAEATRQRDAFELAAIKTIAAISHIWPKFVRDTIDLKAYDRRRYQRQIDQAAAELAIAQRNLQRARIASPVDGVLLRRHETRRQYLQAGTPLLTIGRLEDMDVVADVLTERATHLHPGDPVDIYGQAILDAPLAGEVLRVYPAGFTKISSLGVEQQRVKVAVALHERPEGLGVGFRVRVRIFYDEAPDALTLPRTALFRAPDGRWQVIVVRDGTTHTQPVTLGLTTEDDVQILEGVTRDDQVVRAPSRELAAPTRVQVRSTR